MPVGAASWNPRAFYVFMAVLALVITFAGFAPTYYLRQAFDGPPLASPLVHVHGVLFSAWIILFLAQAGLVATRRVALHRRLGMAGAALALAMIAVAFTAAVASAARGHSPIPIPPLVFLVVPVTDVLVFAALVGAAFGLRRTPDAHKRFMVLATITIITPAIARLPFEFIQTYGPLAFFGLTDLLVAGCLLFDWLTLRRIHWATLSGAILLVASQPLRLMFGGTDVWLSIAGWLTGLV